jgi:ElaB/YqjD/DUF883 family membrane-anchored ribosome-binding protein
MKPQDNPESETLRSEIDSTRGKMDETIDALENRLHGRHLIDEVVGFFRRGDHSGEVSEWREKLSRTAETVVDSVKAHPVPLIMIGAGIAWLAYENRRGSRRSSDQDDFSYPTEDYSASDFETEQGSVGMGETYATGESTEEPSGESDTLAGRTKEKLSSLGQKAREKASDLGERTRQTLGSARERVADVSRRTADRSREIYGKTRETVSRTADRHPLELGIGLLALGVIAGMAIPTPETLTRKLAPAGNKLRETGTDLLQKGKRVAQAATEAARAEAKTQGLTLDRVREQASAVGHRASEAAADAAKQEGLPVGRKGAPSGAPETSNSAPSAPPV